MKILAIDGNSILNRAFYGIKLLSNSKGFFTNAITGFMNIYLKEIDVVKPDCTVVAFDLKATTFRHKKVESYKANRKGMPEELASQLPIIKEVLTYLGVKIISIEGFEADDVLGSISKLCTDTNNECIILTGDRDNLQLINKNVTIRLATNKDTISFNDEKFIEDYGFLPINLIDLKALMGDSSDNISGVKGIGEKTATTLISEYKTVENLYNNLENASVSAGIKAKLENGKDDAFTSKWLATIALNAPIPQNIDNYLSGDKDIDSLRKLLTNLEMFKLLDRLKLEKNEDFPDNKNEQNMSKKFDLKVENMNLDIINSYSANEIANFIFESNQLSLIKNNIIYTTEDETLIENFFENDVKKYTFAGKFAHKFMIEKNRSAKNIAFSCDLAGYLLNSTSTKYTIQNLCDNFNIYYDESLEKFADIVALPSLCERLLHEIKVTEMENLLLEIEQPLCEVLASMEVFGVKIDVEGVREFGEELRSKISEIESQIFTFSKHDFNISSPKQLAVVLFEELGLPVKKKTKTGVSTNAEVLESLADKHPIIPLILEYRTMTKLNSTYVEGLLKVVKNDQRIHSTFNQTETRTGRISSTEPNIQNIPVRKEIGKNMRKFFIAKDGYTFLDADYSQIELRVLAHVCGDKNMQEAFLQNKDIHTKTASQVFDIPEDFVLPEMRSAAKAVNFGIIYGIGAFSLSKDIGVSVAQADQYIKDYLENFKGVSDYMDKTVQSGINNGFVTTIFGRRRYIPELSAKNKMLQAFGKRAAMNAPIQGAAADIIKIAMVKVFTELKKANLDAKLLLQVHDELIVEVAEKDKDLASKILQNEMENAVKLAVPLTADVNEGKSWYYAKG